jgi:hypothetical protein
MDDRIGVIGSPSTTQSVTADILEDASSSALHGQLVYLTHQIGENHLIALGTITEIRTSNRWHEDPNMRGVLKRYGSLPHLSADGDVRTAEVVVQAAYLAEDSDPGYGLAPVESGGSLSMSPTTGAPISLVTDGFLTSLLRRHRKEIVYLGHIYRSDVRLPLNLRHFGRGEGGGAGEAYHLGVFGMTGSGKSGFAAYLVAAYLRHPDMGFLIMDPQGQFTTEEGLPFSLQEFARSNGRQVKTFAISNDLRLPKDAILLSDLLGMTRFFQDILSIKTADNRESAVTEFQRKLRSVDKWEERDPTDVLTSTLSQMRNDVQALTRIYASDAARNRLVGMIDTMLANHSEFEIGLELFEPLHSLFTRQNLSGEPRYSIVAVLEQTLKSEDGPRPLVVLDFSSASQRRLELLETTAVKARILRTVCQLLSHRAEDRYRNGEPLNLLVVFDEAHRFASESPEDEQVDILARRLTDYVRTTRKYGLGWMFVTQEISSLKRSIYSQLRVRAFGYGLTSGTELQRLRETVGDPSALDLYRSFVDPAAINPSKFPFMITGPVSPLSFTGAPVFLSVYTDHHEFLSANGVSNG